MEDLNERLKAEGTEQWRWGVFGIFASIGAMIAVPFLADYFGFFEGMQPADAKLATIGTILPGVIGLIASIAKMGQGERRARLGIDHLR